MFKLFSSINWNTWDHGKRWCFFLHSCSAERRLHGKASRLGRKWLGAKAFQTSSGDEPPALAGWAVTLLTFFWCFSWLLFCSGTCLETELSAPSFFVPPISQPRIAVGSCSVHEALPTHVCGVLMQIIYGFFPQSFLAPSGFWVMARHEVPPRLFSELGNWLLR